MVARRLALYAIPENSRLPYLSKTARLERVLDQVADVVRQRLRGRHDRLRREARVAAFAHVCGEEVERLGVAVEQHRLESPDPVDVLLDRVAARSRTPGMNMRRMNHASTRSRTICDLLMPERLVPEAGLPVAEAPAGPLERAQRRREPHLELIPVGVGRERLARGAARRDPQHVALAVVVREEVEVELPAHVALLEHGQPPEIVDAANLLRVDARLVERISIVRHVAVRVLEEALELRQLELVELVAREAFRPLQLEVQVARPVRDLPLVQGHGREVGLEPDAPEPL